MSQPSGGYFLIYRSLLELDHHLAEGVACPRFAWVDLIGLATHVQFDKSVKLNLIRLERGEFLASLRYLANRWEWSKNRVARFLHVLEVRGQVGTVRETLGGTVYRIVNYDAYQKPWDSQGTAEGQARDKDNTHQFTKELIGGGGNGTAKIKIPLPKSWTPNDAHAGLAARLGLSLERETEMFTGHAEMNGRTLKNWNAGFTQWLKKAVEFSGRKSIAPQTPNPIRDY